MDIREKIDSHIREIHICNKSLTQISRFTKEFKGSNVQTYLCEGNNNSLEEAVISICREYNHGLKIENARKLRIGGDLVTLLTSLKPNDLLLIEDIQELDIVVAEYLSEAVRIRKIRAMIDKGPSARSIEIDLNPFDLMCTTSETNLLPYYLGNLFLNINDIKISQNIVEQVKQIIDEIQQGHSSISNTLFYSSLLINNNVVKDCFQSLDRVKLIDAKVTNEPSDLCGVLTSLERGDILLIENMHLLNSTLREYLCSALENAKVEIMIDKGPSARSIEIDLNPFILFGFTKDTQSITRDLMPYFKEFININTPIEVFSDKTIQTINNEHYQSLSNNILIPIGMKAGENFDFELNVVNHPHAFIIGQSGSGKSVLLHNIIISMILRYAPEDLQLYLFDFKMGGVEFNRYKSVKHIKALLADDSDIQITLEMLRDIYSQMKERGKTFRNEGVANIVEYNNKYQENKMPSIVVIADECHVMFSTEDKKNRQIQAEISSIISKISKEGRSQGVHLILATQTMAGAEIGTDVINNITDHYLLKCSISDSERMASGSSQITSKLSTGEVYYYHTDEQCQFKSFYHSNEELAEIIDKACEKAEAHNSNGQFYFSGSQVYGIDDNVQDYIAQIGRRNPIAVAGKGVTLKGSYISIALPKDYSENILLFGIDEQEQVTRTTMNLLATLMVANSVKDLNMKFIVFDCLNDEYGEYYDTLQEMKENSLCTIVSGRHRGEMLRQLVDDISSEDVNRQTVLVILGQEKFRELKLDMELPNQDERETNGNDLFAGLDFSDSKSNNNIKTYKDAIQFILERGPELGIHTILQVDKPNKFLFNEYTVTAKDIYKVFKHLIMLRSEENAAASFIDNDIKLETLSDDKERLRAYYHNDENDTYTLFCPFEMPSKEIINNLIK